jgi:flagellar biosynthesis chaperone FliJ
MKTPFDGAIRLGQREIDEMRIAISIEVAQSVQIEAARDANLREMERQRAHAADDALLSSHAYMTRLRDERARLRQTQHQVDEKLQSLRAKAITAYGTLKAVSTAAESWRTDAEQAIAKTEQGHLDDLTNANFVRRAGA